MFPSRQFIDLVINLLLCGSILQVNFCVLCEISIKVYFSNRDINYTSQFFKRIYLIELFWFLVKVRISYFLLHSLYLPAFLSPNPHLFIQYPFHHQAIHSFLHLAILSLAPRKTVFISQLSAIIDRKPLTLLVL